MNMHLFLFNMVKQKLTFLLTLYIMESDDDTQVVETTFESRC